MPDLSLTYDEIDQHIAMLLGETDSRAAWDSLFERRVDLCRRQGLRKFYAAHQWSFLRPRLTISLPAAFTTGTVAIAAGVVTLTGGVFPAWAADAWLNVEGGMHEVSTRDSNTQLTLADTSVALAAGADFTLRRYRIELPANFGGMEGELMYAPHQTQRFRPAVNVGEYRIRLRYQNQQVVDSREVFEYGIYPKTHDAVVGQRWYMIFWPPSSAIRSLVGRYRANPGDLSDVDEYPLGGPMHAQTILEACLSEAEVKFQDGVGEHTNLYAQALARSVSLDRETESPDHLGRMRDALGWGSAMTPDGYLIDSSAGSLALYEGHEADIIG